MKTKALFFDIDGTLVSFKTHHIPQSTVDALHEAHKRGIKIVIATGRPFSIVTNLSEISDIIDGYITANGAFCFIGKHVVHCEPVPEDDVKTVIRFAREMQFACLIAGERDTIFYQTNDTARRIFNVLLDVHNVKETEEVDDVLQQRILELTPIITEAQEREIMPHINGCISLRWHPEFTDITSRKAEKSNGIRPIAQALGIEMSETMAFGDGGNDKEMLRKAGIGVAMGNALEPVKSVADYVTSSVDDDGIARALKHFQVI